jgi:hypothetical protein
VIAAGARLANLSGLGTATAAEHLAAIGAGTTAASRMVARSGLPSATAAVHLLQDVASTVDGAGSGSAHRRKLRTRANIEHDARVTNQPLHPPPRVMPGTVRDDAPADIAAVDEDFNRKYWAHFMALALRYYN